MEEVYCRDCKFKKDEDIDDMATVFSGYCEHQKTYIMDDWCCGEGIKKEPKGED